MAKRKPSRAKKAAKGKPRKKAVRTKAGTHRRRTRRKKPVRGKRTTASMLSPEMQGLGSAAGGQAGDTQGLPHFPSADSESVEELADEGQAFEAGIVDAVENAPDADEAEVHTSQVPEVDVPPEYRGRTEKEQP